MKGDTWREREHDPQGLGAESRGKAVALWRADTVACCVVCSGVSLI